MAVMNGTAAADSITGTSNNDTIYGLDGDDRLYGGKGSDSLYGGNGNDFLQGSDGNDLLDGGAGLDTASFADAAGAVTADLTAGTATGSGMGVDTLVSIENLEGSSYDDVLTGDANANTLTGGAGNDNLIGGAGNDALVGGGGNDILNGGNGSDTAGYYDAGGPITVNLASGTVTGTGVGQDTFISIENVYGSSYDDLINGDSYSNTLNGGKGNDKLAGGAGNDTLIGGAGNDILDGGADSDTANYSDATGPVTANLVTALATAAGVGTDTLVSIENLVGSAFNDSLTGDDNSNTLFGGGGNDALVGGAGDDFLFPGVGSDVLDGGAGIDTVSYDDLTTAVSFAVAISTTSVEILIGTKYDDNIVSGYLISAIYGGGGNDQLVGQPNNCVLHGGDGNDSIIAVGENSYLYGDAGDDRLSGNYSSVVDGGAGSDTAVLSQFSTVTVNLVTGIATGFKSDGVSVSEILISVENIEGSGGNDVIVGDTNSNKLWGDFVGGKGGGNDELSGGLGDDYLYGMIGNDNLKGDAGNDFLYGGAGNDVMAGGDGIDTAVFSANQSVNYTITKTATGLTVNSASEGFDTLSGIERLSFTDKTLCYDIAGNAGQTYRVYQAAFNRTPDNGGLKYWIDFMDKGGSLQSVAAGFIDSTEFKLLYGTNPTNDQFVTKLYSNVLHRAPEQAGYDYWLGRLNSGTISRTDTLVQFSESPENQAGVIGVIQDGIVLLA